MRRANLEIKKKERGERKAAATKKMKEEEERLRRRGELITKKQPKISIYGLRRKEKDRRGPPKGKGLEWDKERKKRERT